MNGSGKTLAVAVVKRLVGRNGDVCRCKSENFEGNERAVGKVQSGEGERGKTKTDNFAQPSTDCHRDYGKNSIDGLNEKD